MTCTFRLVTVDGARFDLPSFQTVAAPRGLSEKEPRRTNLLTVFTTGAIVGWSVPRFAAPP